MESASKTENTVVPILRERPALYGVPGNAEKSFSIHALKERVVALMAGAPAVPEVALCVVSTLQQIVAHESGRVQFDEALEETLHGFAADNAIGAAVRSLYVEAKGVLHDSLQKKEVAPEVSEDLLLGLTTIVDWYGQRSSSIKKIASDEKLLKPGTEGFFDFRALHDRERFGAFGLEVRTGLLLDSRGGETLWLRGQILFRGKYLKTREGWESWTTQDSDTFAIELPLVCKDTKRVGRTIVDSLNLFIPYAALQWPEDLQGKAADVSIVLSVYTRSGEKLFSQVHLETMRVMQDVRNEPHLISPQAAEVWESCPVSGHSLNRLQMFWVEGAERGAIEVAFDAVLFGMAGKEVSVLIRILDSEGNGVQSVNEQLCDAYGYYCNQYLLSVASVIARFNDLVSTIDPLDLALDRGENALRLEVTLRDAQERILCGTVEPFTVNLS